MAKDGNTFAKRQRETLKRQKQQDKRLRRQKRKEQPVQNDHAATVEPPVDEPSDD